MSTIVDQIKKAFELNLTLTNQELVEITGAAEPSVRATISKLKLRGAITITRNGDERIVEVVSLKTGSFKSEAIKQLIETYLEDFKGDNLDLGTKLSISNEIIRLFRELRGVGRSNDYRR